MNTKEIFEEILKEPTVIANDLEEPQLLYSREQMTEAYNMGVMDSADAATMVFHDGVTKQNYPTKWHQDGAHNLQVNKDSTLNLLIK